MISRKFRDRLGSTGTGVEGVETLGAAFDGVVVGYVETCEEHPDSDHMHVVAVNVGGEEPIQIVCGAPNIAQGIKVPVATVGAVLPGDFKIKKSKLRGVASCGMCCSKRELGSGTKRTKGSALPEDAVVGTPIADYLGLTDTVLDLEIYAQPPGPPVHGGLRARWAPCTAAIGEPTAELEETGDKTADAVSVELVEADRCRRYTARLIRDEPGGPEPQWLVERLTAIGQRSVNNIVDVTNYVLFELGQPLHTFDFDTLDLEDGKARILVRPAQDGEKLVTLDGEERELTSDMTVIATPKRAAALAGVMGGLDSELPYATANVLLRRPRSSRPDEPHEPQSGLDQRVLAALRTSRRRQRHRCARRLRGEPDRRGRGRHGVRGSRRGPAKADGFARIDVPHRPLPEDDGADIRAIIVDCLTRLGCGVSEQAEGVLAIEAPTFRPDLEREIDLYEEVLRLYGMDRIPSTLPAGRGRLGVRTQQRQAVDAKLHAALSACGMNETMTYSFAAADDVEKLRMSERAWARPPKPDQPDERRPVLHAPHDRSRPAAQRRLQPEPRRGQHPALRDGHGILRTRGLPEARGAPQAGGRPRRRHGRYGVEQRRRLRFLRRQGRARVHRARAGAAQGALQGPFRR